jgi:hypothetical protein
MAVLALATTLVAPHQLARLNTVVLSVETLADLTVSPLLWKLWSTALDTGGDALGLPWFAVSLAFFVVAAILGLLRTEASTDDDTTGDVPTEGASIEHGTVNS